MRIDTNETRLWFDVNGPTIVPEGSEMRQRPTVVLVHGGPGVYDHSYFKPDFDVLAEHAQVVYSIYVDTVDPSGATQARGHSSSVRTTFAPSATR